MRLQSSILGVLVVAVGGCCLAQAACSARTPQQALPSGWAAATRVFSDSSFNLYRLERIVVDPELHRRWALIADCTHPERPLAIIALSMRQPILPTPPAAPILSAAISPAPSTHTVFQQVVQTEGVRGDERSSLPVAPAGVTPMPISKSIQNPSALVPVIRAGDLVRLWSSDSNVRLEMEVVSLEYGRVGQIIHVRRMGQTTLLAGVVVGKDSAELIP
ncbi:MAG TPA: flagella basal body P-ring formation protein FlgA [Acidobacteriaceae bacterium]|nr:flagella basal body P-ring formation protein FlgA [Acidobacteriaceae bacterium]